MSFKQKAKLLIESFEVPIETDIIEPATKVIMAVGIFLCAILFRYGHYQDLIPMVAYGKQDFSGITAQHETTASAILKDGVQAIFPSEWRDKTDTSLIQYPPGYGLMLSAIYYVNGRDPSGVQFVQGILGSIAAVLVFLIALEIFNRYVALIAGLATAISHHLAYYSMLMIPDGVVPVFTLAGTYFFIRAFKVSWDKDKGYLELALAGLFYGLSCWIRANVLLVWVFLGLVLLISRSYLVDPLKRVALLTFILLLVISPLTVRNYLIYDEFIPIS
ncbi:MAG: glycosyltransferase family 39 protein, partial [Blastocatellia bacterium]|nr:glycosyltransferase family 39 protein [Blastocatellia bacterium]